MTRAPLDLRRLTQFAAVADHASLASAAVHLHITQQALSTAMRQLERELEATLFDRRGRRLRLTAAGRRLRDGAAVLLAAAEALGETVREAAGEQSRPYVVGHSPAISPEEAFVIVEPIRRALPQLSVTVRQLFPDELQDGLLARSVDVGLRRGATTPPDLAAAVISYDPLRIAVRAGHPLSDRVDLQVGDISDFTLVVWAPPTFSFYTDFLVSVCRRAGFEPTLAVDNLQGVPSITAVAENDHVALVTAPVGPALGGRVMVCPMIDPPMMPVQAVWLPHTVSEARAVLLAPSRADQQPITPSHSPNPQPR